MVIYTWYSYTFHMYIWYTIYVMFVSTLCQPLWQPAVLACHGNQQSLQQLHHTIFYLLIFKHFRKENHKQFERSLYSWFYAHPPSALFIPLYILSRTSASPYFFSFFCFLLSFLVCCISFPCAYLVAVELSVLVFIHVLCIIHVCILREKCILCMHAPTKRKHPPTVCALLCSHQLLYCIY